MDNFLLDPQLVYHPIVPEIKHITDKFIIHAQPVEEISGLQSTIGKLFPYFRFYGA